MDTADGGDPVLASLGHAREAYLREKDAWDHRQEEADQEREEAHQARIERDRAAEELRQARALLARDRQRAEHQKRRADHLAEHLKSIHRALVGGNIFQLILKACMGITGATRGLYVAAWGDGRFLVRAAVEMGGPAGRPPSPFVEAICREALAGRKTLLCNGPDSLGGLPKPAGPHETFRNCMVPPPSWLRKSPASCCWPTRSAATSTRRTRRSC